VPVFDVFPIFGVFILWDSFWRVGSALAFSCQAALWLLERVTPILVYPEQAEDQVLFQTLQSK
ncbi:hypothetical protein NDU88_007719, partial [Pleurodeles waltl]